MRGIAKYIWIFLFVAFVGGFLLGDMSGLIGRAPVTSATIVGKVNGDEIPYLSWQTLVQQLRQQQEQQAGRALTLDDQRQLEEQAFEQMVSDLLLQQEYERRGIRVSDAEIKQAALSSPPPQLMQNPDLQTDGRFDLQKYQRFLSSPVAKQQGLLVQLENYYRTELPRAKLFSQLIADAYVSDARLWQNFRDERDSATVRFVALRPAPAEIATTEVSDSEVKAFYDRFKDRWTRPGRAVVSLVTIDRTPSAADTAATRARALALRAEILSGAAGSSFADVARRESADTVSGAQGGDLGRGGKGRFVPAFETAAYALRPNQISEPVLTAFGWHLIQVTDRKGDTLSLRHILLKVEQADSSATATDRRADRLSAIAAGSSEAAKLDSAAAELKLLISQIPVQDGQQASYLGRPVPGLTGWAFSGPVPGEISDLLDDENGYYLARLDSLSVGGPQPFAVVKEEIRSVLKSRKAAAAQLTKGEALLREAKATSLAAAAAKGNAVADSAGPFTRLGFIQGLGYANEAIGAAFSIPVGGLGLAQTDEAVVVMQVLSRVEANRTEFEAMKGMLREQALQGARERRVRLFLDNLRKEAKIVDRRNEINAGLRRQSQLAP